MKRRSDRKKLMIRIVAIVMAVALSPITALAFVTGGVMSAAAGYSGRRLTSGRGSAIISAVPKIASWGVREARIFTHIS